MARKKMKQTVKSKAKKTATTTKRAPNKSKGKTSSLMLAESIEKDFRHVPAKLAALYRKDLAVVKQQLLKLKASLKKAQAQMKIVKAKQSTLVSKGTPAAKKQLVNVKKAHDKSHSTVNQLAQDLESLNKHGKMLSHKQSKFSTLGKELLKIEKELDLQAKQVTEKPVKATKTQAHKKPVKKAKVARKGMDSTHQDDESENSASHSEPVEFTS